jgi:REP element-mobilizing transposase RayT
MGMVQPISARKTVRRCPGWDYASPGAYFVTVCTLEHRCYFGEVKAGKMVLNDLGEILKEEIELTETIRKNVIVDSWVIMPNHVHLIVVITEEDHVATPRRGVATDDDRRWKPGCLGAIINHLKGACTRRIRSNLNPTFAWQPRFYDHIIRGEHDLDNLRLYIMLNPENWHTTAAPVKKEAAIHA